MMHELTSGFNAWEFLSEDEKDKFFKLKNIFLRHELYKGRTSKTEIFSFELFALIHWFLRDQRTIQYKCKIVGIAFLGPYICIHTNLLSSMLNRSKSSINDCLLKLGYKGMLQNEKTRSLLLMAIPSLHYDFAFFRQWSVRVATKECKYCFICPISHASFPDPDESDFRNERV